MSAPSVQVYLSHDNSSFTEVTSSVAAQSGMGVSFQRGRSRVLGEWLPGTCTITCRNHLRAIDPTNDSATFQVRPGDAIKILVKSTEQWHGWVDSVRVDGYQQAAGVVYSTLTITGSDDLAWLSRQLGSTFHITYLTSSVITNRLADLNASDGFTSTPYPRASSIATGLIYASIPAAGSKASVLSNFQEMTRLEGGASALFIAKDGTLTWLAQDHRASQVVAFGGSGIGINDIVTDYTDDEWYNSASITPTNYSDALGTSTTSLTVGTGSKTFTLAGTVTEVGCAADIESDGSTAAMLGTVTAFNVSTGSCTVNVGSTAGSGTHTDWTITFTPNSLEQTAADAQAYARFGGNTDRNYTVTLPFLGNQSALARAYLIAAGKGYPSRRVSSFTVDLGALSSGNQDSVLGLEIGDAASVYFDLGTGDPQIIRQTRFLDGVRFDAPGTGSVRVTFTLGLEASLNFTGTLKQNAATVTHTLNEGVYKVDGAGWVTAHGNLTVTAAGTNNTEVKYTPSGLPAPATNAGTCVGIFKYVDQSVATYNGDVTWDGSDLRFQVQGASITSYLGMSGGGGTAFATANTDTLSFTITYRPTG